MSKDIKKIPKDKIKKSNNSEYKTPISQRNTIQLF